MQRAAYRASYRVPSRGSLLGPIFLVVIGVFALLITTHRINIAYFWQWYGHWWPLILIGAGVLLALESLVFSRYSRIRLGGGVVILIVILVALGIAAAHNHVNWTAVGDQLNVGDDVDLSQIFGTKHEASEQIIHALPVNATVVIQNPRGNITVTSSSETASDSQIHLTLHKTVYSSTDSETQRTMQALEPLITLNGSVMTIHMPAQTEVSEYDLTGKAVAWKTSKLSDHQTADMNITLPANVSVQIHAGHGDVTVNGRKAAITINADHGDVQLHGITGPVRVAMRQGDFSASNIQGNLNLSGHMNDVTLSQITGVAALDGDFFGDVHLEKLFGPAHLHSSRTDIQLARLVGSATLDGDDLTVENATGPVSVATQAKDIALRRVTGEMRVNNSNGDVKIDALDPVGAMNIENRNADVQVTLPNDAKFSVKATAADGDIQNDFNLSAQDNNNRSSLSGAVAGGGPLIRISTEKGDIRVHKSTESASK